MAGAAADIWHRTHPWRSGRAAGRGDGGGGGGDGAPESNFHSQVTAYKAKLMGKSGAGAGGGEGGEGGESGAGGEGGGVKKFTKTKAHWFD